MNALVRSAYPESSFFRKLFWLLVYLIATGYMLYGIIDIINAYLSGPITTNTQNECIHRSVFSQLWKPHDRDQPTMTTSSHLFNDMNQTPEQDGEEICLAPFADLDIDLLRNGMITFEELLQSTPNKDLLVGYVKSEYAKDVNPSSIENSILHCSFNEEPCRNTTVGIFFAVDLLRNGMITFEELVQSTPNKDLLVGYVKSEYGKDVNPSSIEKSILHCSFNEEPCRDT
ncbi:unnamed protein product [Darwinula stevensoni]|uniref:Uncharacterized protein n=1 Tax=Darwinula stevensoni TaxID=69355 RepID=A0A7R9A7S9_9CRUS|nr:unnamed protein product [Darwinula stevensoni]CAG0894849.1 unnamed protein product [Darwinula stevensoni]